MKYLIQKGLATLGAVTLFASFMAAQTASLTRYDTAIQQNVARKLGDKKEFQNVRARVEDGIVTLAGTVDVYQQKLDAAKKAAKVDHAAGVRNLIEVAAPEVSDAQLEAKLSEKLRYDRIGYDNLFNFFTLGVKDGVVTVNGETLNDVGRDSALSIIQRMPGVKDVVDNIHVSSVSMFDDDLRIRAARVLYGDSVLNRYAMDPAHPIRIIVDGGRLALYGTVDSSMDKQIAGIRANQLFGAFTVENHLVVENSSKVG
jgi:hyperosmotically inducible periplasmic protein